MTPLVTDGASETCGTKTEETVWLEEGVEDTWVDGVVEDGWATLTVVRGGGAGVDVLEVVMLFPIVVRESLSL